MDKVNQSKGLVQPAESQRFSRRTFVRSASGVLLIPMVPVISGAGCTDDEIQMVLKIAEIALKVTDRIVGYLEARNISSRSASERVYEELYAADSDGNPTGSMITSNDPWNMVVPADGKTHQFDLHGFAMNNPGKYVLVAQSSSRTLKSPLITAEDS